MTGPRRKFGVLKARVGDLLSLVEPQGCSSDRLKVCSEALVPFQRGWHRTFALQSVVSMKGDELVVTFERELGASLLVGVLSLATLGVDGDSPLGRLMVLRLGMSEFPDEPELWFRQGEVLHDAGHYALAEASLIHSEDHDSGIPERHWLFSSDDGTNDRWVERPCTLVSSVIRSRAIPDAIQRLDGLRDDYEDENPDLLNGLGVCHAVLGDYAAAVSHLRAFMEAMEERELRPGKYYDSDRRMLIIGHLNLAWCHTGLGDDLEAAAHFGKALHLTQSDDDTALRDQILGWYRTKIGLSDSAQLTWSLNREYGMLMLHPSGCPAS